MNLKMIGLIWASIFLIDGLNAIHAEYMDIIQDCLYCNDGNPLNNHRFCQVDYGFALCQPEILYLESYCPIKTDQVPSREECYSVVDYFRDCSTCTENGLYYCPRNAKCYSSLIEPEIYEYCNDYIVSYPFCQDEDPNNGCKYQNNNVIDDEVWEMATRTNALEVDLEIQIDAERYCEIYFENAFEDETNRTVLMIIWQDVVTDYINYTIRKENSRGYLEEFP